MTERGVPGTGAMVATLARITLTRLGRGKALWIGLLIAALPVAYAVAVQAGRFRPKPDDAFTFEVLLLVVLPAMFVAASVGEDIEDRTSTYLWSRPIVRWALLAGKLVALTPIVVALSVGSWYAAMRVGIHATPSLASCVALGTGCVAISLAVAGIAVVVPRHSTALAIGYMLVDLFIAAIPASLDELSLTYHTRVLAGFGPGTGGQPAVLEPVIAMAVIAAIWTAIGLARIRRLEV